MMRWRQLNFQFLYYLFLHHQSFWVWGLPKIFAFAWVDVMMKKPYIRPDIADISTQCRWLPLFLSAPRKTHHTHTHRKWYNIPWLWKAADENQKHCGVTIQWNEIWQLQRFGGMKETRQTTAVRRKNANKKKTRIKNTERHRIRTIVPLFFSSYHHHHSQKSGSSF